MITMEVRGILKRIAAIMAAIVICIQGQAMAYNVVDLPNSMTFAEALSIYDADDIASATICNIDGNIYKDLTRTEIRDFYYSASNLTVWRKVNPTPFRGTCINFTTTSGVQISYYFNSGIQIGTYGSDNFICYMPSAGDTSSLRYAESDFFDSDEAAYGGILRTASTSKDFLKLPQDEWAINEIKTAAAKNLVPYEFTDKYASNITREGMAVLIANFICVSQNYVSLDDYMNANGISYTLGNFYDCSGRDEAIDQLFAMGIITGRDDAIFDPDGQITRQEAAVMLVRTAEKFVFVDTKYNRNPADSNKIANWGRFSIMWCIDKGILALDDSNKIYPADPVTVQQAITVLSRLYDLVTYWEY
ncbi:MAG: S-layer homology domain-containing protein [Oscillospiraceae bacterium]|nr:S-layer homology domain-containing protein [Oscillospiraceae bacterium]